MLHMIDLSYHLKMWREGKREGRREGGRKKEGKAVSMDLAEVKSHLR